MRILGENWLDKYLDYALLDGTCRIKVERWRTLASIDGLFYAPGRDWRVVWNYIKEFGVVQVLRKIRSRRNEALRNKKYVAVGTGWVLDCGRGTKAFQGKYVAFLAPAHPRCVERVVLPEFLILELMSPVSAIPEGLDFCAIPAEGGGAWQEWQGWSEYSGLAIDPRSLQNALPDICHCPGLAITKLSTVPVSPLHEIQGREPDLPQHTLRGVLFGLGHYAKTNILPNVDPGIRIVKVHEIDPTQLSGSSFPFVRDTSPLPRDGETFDVYFLAGFHHTHAPLASHALDQGAWAIVEKPIATSREDLDRLLVSVQQRPGKLFPGFHKRYSTLNALALEDLECESGEPISYFCIVHEARLPRLHWYRWPNSRTRLVSNGCHWIDHFLFLNHFSEPVRYDAWETSSGDICAVVELENGAAFTMTLTDQGSSRIGVEDYVELRAGDRTVRIVNGANYTSESSRKVVRRKRVNRTSSYADMYGEISRKVAQKIQGDSLQAIRCSAQLVLDLESCLAARKRHLVTAE